MIRSRKEYCDNILPLIRFLRHSPFPLPPLEFGFTDKKMRPVFVVPVPRDQYFRRLVLVRSDLIRQVCAFGFFFPLCLHPTGRFFGHKGLTRLFILVFLTKSATRCKCIRIIWLSRLTASTISRSVVAGHFTDHLGSHSWDFVDIPLINFYRASSRENNPRWLAQSHDPQTKCESRYATPAVPVLFSRPAPHS